MLPCVHTRVVLRELWAYEYVYICVCLCVWKKHRKYKVFPMFCRCFFHLSCLVSIQTHHQFSILLCALTACVQCTLNIGVQMASKANCILTSTHLASSWLYALPNFLPISPFRSSFFSFVCTECHVLKYVFLEYLNLRRNM